MKVVCSPSHRQPAERQELLAGRMPWEIEGRLGYFAFDLSAAITAGTWAASQP